MKTIIMVFTGIVFSILIGCNQKYVKSESKLVGIWQNTENPISAIEFAKNGDYFVRLQGQRSTQTATDQDIENIKKMDSTVQNSDVIPSEKEFYTYDSITEGINFKILTDKKLVINQGRIEFLSHDKIRLTLYDHDTIVSKAEFTRVAE